MINALTNKNFVEELKIAYFHKVMGKSKLKEYFTDIATDRSIEENRLLFDHFWNFPYIWFMTLKFTIYFISCFFFKSSFS